MIAVSIYCYFIKYQANHLLPFHVIFKHDSDNELKEIDIKNRTCYYFDNVIKIEDFDFDNISIDEKSRKNVVIYKISDKTLVHIKPFSISSIM